MKQLTLIAFALAMYVGAFSQRTQQAFSSTTVQLNVRGFLSPDVQLLPTKNIILESTDRAIRFNGATGLMQVFDGFEWQDYVSFPRLIDSLIKVRVEANKLDSVKFNNGIYAYELNGKLYMTLAPDSVKNGRFPETVLPLAGIVAGQYINPTMTVDETGRIRMIASGSSGSGGGGTWGTITGSLSNQADLSAALSSKQNVIPNGSAGQWRRWDNTWGVIPKSDVGLGNVPNVDATNADNLSTGTIPQGRFPSSVVLADAVQTLLNKTLSNPKINLGSDATGDMYVRNSLGGLSRIPGGADGQVMKWNSGAPGWGTDNTGSGEGATALDSLDDVDPSASMDYHGLVYYGGQWTKRMPIIADLSTIPQGGIIGMRNNSMFGYNIGNGLDSVGRILKVDSFKFATLHALSLKQALLVSGSNLKTVNGQSLLGSGNLTINPAVAWGGITGTITSQTDLQSALGAKENTITPGTASQLYFGDKVFRTPTPATVGLGNVPNIDATNGNNITTGTIDLNRLPANIATTNSAQNFENKTLTYPTINVGSDAAGDMYYRLFNVDRNRWELVRIPIGSLGQVLKIGSPGVPAWGTDERGVTSIGLTMPGGFSVSSPIVSSGNINVTTSLNGFLKGSGGNFIAQTQINDADISGLSWAKVSDKPTIPTNTNQLTNGAAFMKETDNISAFINGASYGVSTPYGISNERIVVVERSTANTSATYIVLPSPNAISGREILIKNYSHTQINVRDVAGLRAQGRASYSYGTSPVTTVLSSFLDYIQPGGEVRLISNGTSRWRMVSHTDITTVTND